MKHPLRSPRVNLVSWEGEWRVTLDGLTKGFLVRRPMGDGGGWWWRQSKTDEHGHERTKEGAVAKIIGAK